MVRSQFVVLVALCVALSSCVCHASYTPTQEDVLYESFDGSWQQRWTQSAEEKYTGEWSVEGPIENAVVGVQGDVGLVMKSEARHHAISAKFPQGVFTLEKGQTLFVQYEVRTQAVLTCGGAYMKLLSADADVTTLHDKTPWVIMFGPDKCDANRVHFILRYLNPITKEYEEHAMTNPPAMRIDTLTHLYGLELNTNDDSFKIYVDGEVAREGNLATDFEPPIEPPKEIEDPEDSMPEDYVTQEYIADPEATKPEDWDEEQPRYVIDTADTKPSDWLDSEPLLVPDPSARAPEDWDEEEDGEWTAPLVENPVCSEVSGCGEWQPRQIENPLYQGKWRAPLVKNPAYIGPWHARKIANPNYYAVEDLSRLDSMSAVAFELWTMTKNIAFDNILVTVSHKSRDTLVELWRNKHESEEAQTEDLEHSGFDMYAKMDQFLSWLVEHVGITGAQVTLIVTLVLVILLFACCCVGGKKKSDRSAVIDEPSAAHKAEKEAEEEGEVAEEEAEVAEEEGEVAEEEEGADAEKEEEPKQAEEEPALLKEEETKKKSTRRKSNRAPLDVETSSVANTDVPAPEEPKYNLRSRKSVGGAASSTSAPAHEASVISDAPTASGSRRKSKVK